MPLASTHFTPFFSISTILYTPASTQTKFYTNHSLYTKSFLHQALLAETHFATNQLLHEPAFPQTRFSTNHLLHQPALHKRVFAHSSFYANQLFDHQLYTKHVLHQQSLPCACMPKAKGPAVCRRLLNMGSFINTTNKLHPLSPKHGRQHSCFSQPVRWRVVRFYVSCPAASFSSATAGPQLQALDRSVSRRTRTATSGSLPAGPQPRKISEDIPDRMPERMSEDMPDTCVRKNVRKYICIYIIIFIYICHKYFQMVCQKLCQNTV